MRVLKIGAQRFRLGQRVVAVVIDNPALRDIGRITQIGYGDGGPNEHPQIAIKSDALGGKKGVFLYLWREKFWRLHFQSPPADPKVPCYKSGKSAYQIEGLD